MTILSAMTYKSHCCNKLFELIWQATTNGFRSKLDRKISILFPKEKVINVRHFKYLSCSKFLKEYLINVCCSSN